MITRRMLSSLLWMLVSLGGSQIVRLLGNLVLTRLLVPEMFGLMVLANAAIMGLGMFSDVGIRGALINSKRAREDAFCDTAWTMQMIRGGLMYLLVLALCVPIANFYEQPILAPMLVACGLTTIILGLTPIKMYYLIKEVDTKLVSLIDLGAQVLGMAVLIVLAYEWRSVWALVWGSLAGSVFQVIGYYLFLPGRRNRFFWDKTAFSEIFRYGRWVVLSTGSLYLSMQGDKLIIGKFLSLEFVGVYGIAITFSMLINDIGEKVASRFLFPIYRKFMEVNPPQLKQVRKYRTIGVIFGVIACSPLVIGGQWLIDVLYDERYQAAGWMLQFLAIAGVLRLFDSMLRPLFLAVANSFDSMVYQVIKGCLSVTLLLVGIWNYGLQGFLMALIIAPVLNLVVLNIMMRRHGYRWNFDDIPLLGLVAALAYFGWQLMGASPLDSLSMLG